jgi:hypothetical protein
MAPAWAHRSSRDAGKLGESLEIQGNTGFIADHPRIGCRSDLEGVSGTQGDFKTFRVPNPHPARKDEADMGLRRPSGLRADVL